MKWLGRKYVRRQALRAKLIDLDPYSSRNADRDRTSGQKEGYVAALVDLRDWVDGTAPGRPA